MATYAIGDVQGCDEPLGRLLERIDFSAANDRLWFAGDLVNRGPDSLGVLRRVRKLGDAAITVLGNHDIHLLARAAGLREPRPRDSFDEILAADDRDELIDWLRRRPLVHREDGWLLVHAGLLPHWTVAETVARARRLEAQLTRGDLEPLYLHDKITAAWPDCTSELERDRLALATFTRLRVVTADGRPVWSFTGPPEDAPEGAVAWFELPGLWRHGERVLFGHWAALGLRRTPQAVGLDSGCVWGHCLTALRLDDLEVFQEPCA